jgi:hypothetical protein
VRRFISMPMLTTMLHFHHHHHHHHPYHQFMTQQFPRQCLYSAQLSWSYAVPSVRGGNTCRLFPSFRRIANAQQK